MESLGHHLFFCTLTYNNENLPKITTSTGFDIRYADYRDIQLLIKRIRNNNLFGRSFKYIAVSERGSIKARPHFHVIFCVDKLPDDTYSDIVNLQSLIHSTILQNWVKNVGSKRSPKYVPLCTYVSKFVRGKLKSNYDLHYIQPLNGDSCCSASFYVLKYMLKPSDKESKLQQALKLNLPPDEYDDIWQLVKSRYFLSKGFGDPDNPDVIKYVRDCVNLSSQSSAYPQFFNIDTGQGFPLARYYKDRGHLYSLDDALKFFFNGSHPTGDSSYDLNPDYEDIDNSILKFDKVQSFQDNNLSEAELFDELYEN